MICRSIKATCHACGTIVDWKATVAFVERPRLEIVLCLECPRCGQLVPLETWYRYRRTGDIRVLS